MKRGAPEKIMIKFPKIPIRSMQIRHNLFPIFSEIAPVIIDPKIAPKGNKLVRRPSKNFRSDEDQPLTISMQACD